MIKPIQQSVVFKGAETSRKADSFKGGNKIVSPSCVDVRANYANAVNNVQKIQQHANELSKTAGQKLDKLG